MHHAEHRGAGANPDRQGTDRGQGEDRAPGQAAQTVADVAQGGLDSVLPSRAPHFLAHRGGTTDLDQRRPPGRFRAESALEMRRGSLLEIVRDFLRYLRIGPPGPQERAESPGQFSRRHDQASALSSRVTAADRRFQSFISSSRRFRPDRVRL